MYPYDMFRNYARAASYERYQVKRVDGPSEEPVSLADVYAHLRIATKGTSPETSDEDAVLNAIIPAAREWCEHYLGAAIGEQTFELGLSYFPGQPPIAAKVYSGFIVPYPYANNGILLPFATNNVTVESVKYDVSASALDQTLASTAYYVDDFARPAMLYPVAGTMWPTAWPWKHAAVRVTYTAGYPVLSVPFSIRAAMLLMIGHLYLNREQTSEATLNEVPLAAQSLLERYRVRTSMA